MKINIGPYKSYKSKIPRKVNIHIDDYDTWNFDHTMALILHPMFVKYKEHSQGFGLIDPDDLPEIGKGDESEYGGYDDKAEERWNWFIDEMIWVFEYLSKDNDWLEELKLNDRIDRALKLFGKYFRAIWN
jgi:hypothetical protein